MPPLLFLLNNKIMAAFILGLKLKPWIHSYNLKYLSDNACDDTLYRQIWQHDTSARIEGSVKISTASSDKEHRYTVTLPLRNFSEMPETAQAKILGLVNFTVTDYKDILSKEKENISKAADNDTDIIFGWTSKGIGKIYFDYDGSLVCYESGGKIKYYQCDTPDKIRVTDHNGKNIATHYRIKDPQLKFKFNNYPVYWIAKSKESKTWYTRPIRAMMLSDIADIFSIFF
jgi:hypothetical protein